MTFVQQVIDPTNAGDVKLVGDIDGDEQPDLVIGGMPDEGLSWYRYPGWSKTPIAVPAEEFTTDGALGDVDGDGDLDIVVPDGSAGENLLWFVNPRPDGNPLETAAWKRQQIGSIGDLGKDVELADFDGDGRLDVAIRSPDSVLLYFQQDGSTWQRVAFADLGDIGKEGLASGDIDRDGQVDLVLNGSWMRNPGGAQARDLSRWGRFDIGAVPDEFKALVVDLNQDGVTDVLFSYSESTADVNWWSPIDGNPTGTWEARTILPEVERVHTLQAADMDLDGDLDVVLAQMHTSETREVMILYNADGAATSWRKEVIATTGLHNGVVADIGQDGDFDIFGANFTGNPPVLLFENTAASAGRWHYIQADDSRAERAFGLAFGDVNGDGQTDIVSGRYVYHNPGGDLSGPWSRSTLPVPIDACLTLDVDGDELADIIAQALPEVYWLEAENGEGTSWTARVIGSVPPTSNTNGQGCTAAQIVPGGRPEVLIAGGETDNEIYSFQIPDDPEQAPWPRTQLTDTATDEWIAVGDVDGDGDLDIAGGVAGGESVAWWANPGEGSGGWPMQPIGAIADGNFPNNARLGDIDGDGRLDLVVAEENGGSDPNASVYWFRQPADPRKGDWQRSTITTQYSTNSMDVADIDGDGDPDIITGEHRGEKRTIIWENWGGGATWVGRQVSTGRESHQGARAADLDGDSDLDITSIAFDDFQYLHLWRNDAPVALAEQLIYTPNLNIQ